MRLAASLLLLGTSLLFADTDADAAKKALRIAWASQYEWKEDKVRNVTLDFTWNYRWKGRRAEDEWRGKASGVCVIADGELKRVHLESGDRSRIDSIRAEIGWVLRRFIRKPFDEAFEETKFRGPEKIANDRIVVRAGELGFILHDDRIVGYERNIGTEAKPNNIRVDCKTADLGGGYAVLEEKSEYDTQAGSVSIVRVMNTKGLKEVPMPSSYVHESKQRGNFSRTELAFTNPRANDEHPVVLDPEARDAVKAAWEARYRLPAGTRVDGQWNREPDNATAKGGWMRKAYGEFQFLGTELEVLISEKLRINEGTRRSLSDSVTGHVRQIYELVLDRPFDKAFEGVGFVRDESSPGVVRLLGHPAWTAVRVEQGVMSGHEDRALGGDGGWWDYRHTKAKDGRLLVSRMTRKVAGKKWHAKISYSKKKGISVPKSAEVLVPARVWNRDPTEVGMLKYTFRRLDVIAPK
ncbi:MAG: hypothetical protein AAGD14_01090 [Planctomycetota bacterium]